MVDRGAVSMWLKPNNERRSIDDPDTSRDEQ